MNAPALELVPTETGTGIRELIVGIRKGTALVRATNFVVCAGALETPRLLLNSRQRSSVAVGNEHGLVGRYLLDHPMGYFGKLRFHGAHRARLYADMASSPEIRLRAGLQLRPEQQFRRRLPNSCVWIRPSLRASPVKARQRLSFLGLQTPRDIDVGHVRAILTDPDLLYRILVYRCGFSPIYLYGDLLAVTEQLPNPRSCVRLSDRCDRFGYPVAEINWQLCEADFSCFRQYAELLSRAGLKSRQYNVVRIDAARWVESVSSSAHHLGTARMAGTAPYGVVDRNLRVFGVENLFVCDGSVFPAAGSVNPSLTIVALAQRLGEQLLRSQGR